MDATVAALLGLFIGGSLASWVAQRMQVGSQLLAQEIRRRQELYGEFVEAASCCYARALQGKKPDTGRLARIHNEIGRMRHHSSDTIVQEAIRMTRQIRDTYDNPHRIEVGMNVLADDLLEFFGEFSDACRAELVRLQRHGLVQRRPRDLFRCPGSFQSMPILTYHMPRAGVILEQFRAFQREDRDHAQALRRRYQEENPSPDPERG